MLRRIGKFSWFLLFTLGPILSNFKKLDMWVFQQYLVESTSAELYVVIRMMSHGGA